MAWKLENIRKDPNSKEQYADLFISQITEEPKTACLFTIGDARAVEIILEKYKNTQFVVFDYPALIKFLEFAKPANLLKAVPLKYDWESENEFLKFVEEELQNYIINNMSFDLIIANPPYGKQCSLAKPIIKESLKACKRLIVLSPRNVFLDNEILEHTSDYKEIKGQMFSDATTWNLHVIQLLNEQNTTKYTIEDICFTGKQKQLYKAVTTYNKSHVPHTVLIDGSYIEPKWEKSLDACTKLPKSNIFKDKLSKKLKDLVKDQEVFVKTLFAGLDGVHFNDCYDFKYNLRNEYDMKWNKGGRPIDFFVFINKQERDNFSDWWYSCNKIRTSKKERIGLTNAFLDLIVAAGRGGVGYFGEYFPNLDWSRTWTDAEILKELGLPEDFLEEKG